MRTLPSFTPAFRRPLPANDMAGPSRPAQQKPAPLTYSSARYRSVNDFIQSADFGQFKQEYTDLLDHIAAFVHDHGNKSNPSLSDETKEQVKDDYDVLKQHLFDFQEDFFGPRKPEIYSVCKEMFHEFAELLQNERIPLQQRIDAVVELAPRARMCSGGLLSDLQETTAALKAANHGLKGIAHQWKKKMMEALILEHIKAKHRYLPSEEIHLVNAYYNKLADEMGVEKRMDTYTSGYDMQISPEMLAQCKAHMSAKLKPTRLATGISDQYRNRIEASLGKEHIIDDDGLRKLDTALLALVPEYGEVSKHKFLEPTNEEWTEMAYIGAKQPIAITRHFLKQLKKEGMIRYDKESKIVLGHAEKNRVLMLDDLLWIKDQDGEVQEFTVSSLFKVAPKELLDNLEKIEPDAQERIKLLRALVRRIQKSLDTAGNAGEELGTWLQGFAGAMKERPSWSPGWNDPLMLLATAFNQASALSDLLAAGGNKDARDEKSGQTLLMLAVRNHYTEAVNILIEAKADANAVDRNNDTGLMIAVDNSDVEAIGSMIKAGADIEARNKYGITALMHAVLKGEAEVVKALIEAGAGIKAKDRRGQTALQHAVRENNFEIVKMLILHGADGTTLLQKNQRALNDREHVQWVSLDGRLVRRQIAANTVGTLLQAGAAVLPELAKQGVTRTLKKWIEKGVDRIKDAQGKTALMRAIEIAASGSEDGMRALEALLKAGANITIRDNQGKTAEDYAIELAAASGNEQILHAFNEAVTQRQNANSWTFLKFWR